MYGVEFGPNMWAFAAMIALGLFGVYYESRSKFFGLLWAVLACASSVIIGLRLDGFMILFTNFNFQ